MDKIKSEHVEQREFVSWFRKSYPGVRIFAIPNGGKRSIAQAARLKVEGVSEGVPDLFIPKFALWIELKKSKVGRPSKAQLDWIKYLQDECGHIALVAAGKDDAVTQVQAALQLKIAL